MMHHEAALADAVPTLGRPLATPVQTDAFPTAWEMPGAVAAKTPERPTDSMLAQWQHSCPLLGRERALHGIHVAHGRVGEQRAAGYWARVPGPFQRAHIPRPSLLSGAWSDTHRRPASSFSLFVPVCVYTGSPLRSVTKHGVERICEHMQGPPDD
jgi:hypothetical protein